jgi:hypothetical protein
VGTLQFLLIDTVDGFPTSSIESGIPPFEQTDAQNQKTG